MMLKTLLVFQGFSLLFGTNYVNDNDWFLGINQAWPLNTCQFNSFENAVGIEGKYLEYKCNNDGSATKYIYKNATIDGECDYLESTVNYTSFTNSGDIGAYNCNSTNDFAQITFTAYFIAPPPSSECVASPTSLFQARGSFKWAVNACSTNGNNSVMFTCDNNPGEITVTSFNNTICSSSNINDVITITEGECVKYIETQSILPPTVPGFGGQTVDIFGYAEFAECRVPTTAPTLMTTFPSSNPTVITPEPSITPTSHPTLSTTQPSSDPTIITIDPTTAPTIITTQPSINPTVTTTQPTMEPTTNFNTSKADKKIVFISFIIFAIVISVNN